MRQFFGCIAEKVTGSKKANRAGHVVF